MSSIGPTTPGAAWFLQGIANVEQAQAQTIRQLSSGYKVQTAADSPALTPDLVQTGSSLASAQDYQTRLALALTEAQTADSSLGTGISLLESARALAVQGADSSATASTRQTLAAQVQSIQQQIVGLANTSVAGRYIFGGASDQSPTYSYSGSGQLGAQQLSDQTPGAATVDTTGQVVYQGLTANQIFDASDSGGNPVSGNVFVALQSLVTALNNNDPSGAGTALDSLKAASDYLNQQQGVYGAAENRIAGEQSTVSAQITGLQTSIGGIRDTDVSQAATQLSAETVQQAAAYGAQSLIPRKSLFDYLG